MKATLCSGQIATENRNFSPQCMACCIYFWEGFPVFILYSLHMYVEFELENSKFSRPLEVSSISILTVSVSMYFYLRATLDFLLQ